MNRHHRWRIVTLINLLLAILLAAPLSAKDVEKVLFLTIEKDEIVASNTKIGRFDRLKLSAKERIKEYKVANAVAVVVTNQRFVAYGVLRGGWQSVRLLASEQTESIEVSDYSANIVTSDRILNFNGRRGTWIETRRSVN
jgi:hypothetical protein